MLKYKMSSAFYQTLPWRIASRKYDTGFYVIHGKDTPDRELQILKLHDGPHPIKEHLDRIENNAEAIVTAVNSTYGSGIDPSAINYLITALESFVEWAEKNAMWDKCGQSYYQAKQALKKAKLK